MLSGSTGRFHRLFDPEGRHLGKYRNGNDVGGGAPHPRILANEVFNEIGSYLPDLFPVYPTAIGLAWDSMNADAGFLSGLAVLLWAVVLLPPHLAGIFFGLITWPELFVLKVLL